MVGYHGCDKQVVEKVLLQSRHLNPSDNPWDWLGKGIYFWEFGPKRALDFAREQQARGKVDEPAVIGAYINLGRCFDLTDIEHTDALAEAYSAWRATFESSGTPPPLNKPGQGSSADLLLRNRDCAVLNWYMGLVDRDDPDPYGYQTVRGVFVEGEPVYEGAGIRTKTHVQIAVRDRACVLGFFLPTFFFEEDEEADHD